MTISKKLILSFLGLTIVVLIATLGLARWSFERGFLDYVNALEETRLQLLATSLSQDYLEAGKTWSKLSEQDFQILLWEQSPERRDTGPGPGRPPPPDFMLPPPGHPPPGHEFPGPGKHLEPGKKGPPMAQRLPPGPGRPEKAPPTALYDIDGQLIAGPALEHTDNPIKVSVEVDGDTVGELRSAPRRHFESPQETAFSRQQLTTSALIAVISLALAAVVSWLLARILLAPIQRMIAGVSKLSNGDYASRLDENRKDELGQLMGNLDRLAHKLEENQTSRRRWLADISHELRTPVTVLTGEIETLKDGIRPLDMQQILSFDQEVTRLRNLIEDLYQLSVSDIGGLRYSFSPVDIRKSLNMAIELIRKRASDKGIEIIMAEEDDIIISADSQRLDQLYTNLFENALAYTDAPGKIEISLTSNEKQVSIRIQDSPPGINQKDCEKLFDPLYREDLSRSRHTAGAGLGLAICRNIMDAHQGRITASPSELGGLCIDVIFPKWSEK